MLILNLQTINRFKDLHDNGITYYWNGLNYVNTRDIREK